jgi:hypothetical protein
LSRADRLTYAGLAAAMLAAAAVLWASRGFVFFNDELGWFATAPPDYDPGVLLMPHNTHLIALPRALYVTSLHLFGPEYLPFRVMGVVGVLLCAGLFFVLARRRIGAVALLPTTVLLFLGSSWDVVVSPIGIPFLYAVASGLGALLAHERNDRRGDLGACALILVAIACHSFGLVFLVGVAVAVLLDKGRVARAWVFAIPLALYAVWWALASSPTDERETLADLSNIVGLPLYAFVSLGAVVAAITGLNLELAGDGAGFNRQPDLNWSLAPPLAFVVTVLFALLLWRRGRPTPKLWVLLAVLVAFWLSIGLSAGPGRAPTAARYIFPGAVIVLLVVVEAVRGMRISRPVLVGLIALTAVSVAVNLVHVRDTRAFLTAYATTARPTLTMVELSAATIEPTFHPAGDAKGASPLNVRLAAKTYLGGVANWGSIAATLAEVRRLPPVVRARADVVLARALGLRLVPAAPGLPRGRCEVVAGAEGGAPATVDLPRGGAILENAGPEPAVARLRRFGPSFAVEATIAPGGRSLLRIPADRASEPWRASLGGGPLRLCELAPLEVATDRVCEIRAQIQAGIRELPTARRSRDPLGALAARREQARETRRLSRELYQVAPDEIREDVQAAIGGTIGPPRVRSRSLAAQKRLEAFEARECRP